MRPYRNTACGYHAITLSDPAKVMMTPAAYGTRAVTISTTGLRAVLDHCTCLTISSQTNGFHHTMILSEVLLENDRACPTTWARVRDVMRCVAAAHGSNCSQMH